jgi:DNA-binding NarL/FixJ family response regulator
MNSRDKRVVATLSQAIAAMAEDNFTKSTSYVAAAIELITSRPQEAQSASVAPVVAKQARKRKTRPYSRLTPVQKAMVQRAYKQGTNVTTISKQFGISKQSVYNYAKADLSAVAEVSFL